VLEKAKARALSDVEPNIEIIKRDFSNAVADFEASIAGLRERMADLQQAIVERLEQARECVATCILAHTLSFFML
jgi:predicted  nucleic acid-binding Zn-ribbon protein